MKKEPVARPKDERMDSTPPKPDPFHQVKQMIQSCIQCGTCTGTCPNTFAMDLTPRRMWRMVLMEREDQLLQSQTFLLCSACYHCTLRCPRGLPLTEAIYSLKRIAARDNRLKNRPGILFYKVFLENIRRNGRIREMELMTRYFMMLKNPVTPFKFASLGMRLMAKGKLSPERKGRIPGNLDRLFRKVEELEGGL